MATIRLILDLLNKENFQTYHRSIARKLKSIDAAIIFDEFIQRHIYHETRKELIEIPGKGKGWFYHTQESIEERTVMTRYSQDKALEILQKNKLIEIQKHGLPCKRYFRLDIQGIEDFSNNLSSLSTVSKQDCEPSANSTADRQQTDSLYIEEPNKEPKEEREGIASPPLPVLTSSKKKKKKPPIEKIAYRENVLLTEIEHDKLLTQYGKEKLEWMLNCLHAKKGANGYEYESDYHVLLPSNWVNGEYTKQIATGKIVRLTTGENTECSDRNKKIAEFAEKKLQHLCTGRVFFQAKPFHALICHEEKQIKIEIEYGAYEPEVFKDRLISDLAICFPGVYEILVPPKQNKVSELISDLSEKCKMSEVS